MNYTLSGFLAFVGSFGIFTIGMKLLGEGLQKVTGHGLRRIFEWTSDSSVFSIFSGTALAALIQSSSAIVNLMVSFSNAGIIKVRHGFRVIIGANLGTVSTIWLLASISEVDDIMIYVLPIIGVTSPLLFSNIRSWKFYGEVISGISFLFIGIHYMKANIPDFQNSLEATMFFGVFEPRIDIFHLLIYVLIGLLTTIMLQSSTVAIVIFSVMFAASRIPVEVVAGMVIGANVGTTLTGLLTAVNANEIGKRVALFHVIFNVVGAIVFIAFFYPIMRFVDLSCQYLFGFEHFVGQNKQNVLTLVFPYAIALFHTYFNVFTALLITPLNSYFEKWLEKIIVVDGFDETMVNELIVGRHIIETPEIALIECEKVLIRISNNTNEMFGLISNMLEKESDLDKLYLLIKKKKDLNYKGLTELLKFLREVSLSNATTDTNNRLVSIQSVIRDMFSINRVILKTSLSLQTKEDLNVEFNGGMSKGLRKLTSLVQEVFDVTLENLYKAPADIEMRTIVLLEDRINIERDRLRLKHLERIEKKKDIIESGLLFRNIYSAIEKIADHLYNVNESIIEVK